jgi:DNA/RNA-binding domain of Phe-tRNA-synthetase-like protein
MALNDKIPSGFMRFEVGRENLGASVLRMSELTVEKTDDRFTGFERRVFDEIRSEYTLEGLKNDPVISAYRDLYWAFGMDPTKLRVSSEALVRRIVKGQNLWRISNVVDVANLASARHRLPIGLIDEDRLVGSLRVRSAQDGEIFTRIGGDEIECRGREIVVSDDKKIVCFGYATHDSEETKITKTTLSCLLIVYAAPGVTRRHVTSAVDMTGQMVNDWIDCSVRPPAYFFA